jgi:DNA polymerase III alpha subunit
VDLLRRLKCNNYKILVAASSIIRPGVAQSGMMKEYFRQQPPTSSNIFMKHSKNIWRETYGVMVYQEDVIKIQHFGVPASDGDVLRRDEW